LSQLGLGFARTSRRCIAAYAKNGERRSASMNAMLTRTLQAVKIKSTSAVFSKQDGKPHRDFSAVFEGEAGGYP
jgi:hypothetical protein